MHTKKEGTVCVTMCHSTRQGSMPIGRLRPLRAYQQGVHCVLPLVPLAIDTPSADEGYDDTYRSSAAQHINGCLVSFVTSVGQLISGIQVAPPFTAHGIAAAGCDDEGAPLAPLAPLAPSAPPLLVQLALGYIPLVPPQGIALAARSPARPPTTGKGSGSWRPSKATNHCAAYSLMRLMTSRTDVVDEGTLASGPDAMAGVD